MSATMQEINASPVFTPLKPLLGARVDGIDLAQPMSDAVFAQIRTALVEYAALVLPAQGMTPEQHITFSRRFGQLEDHVLSDFCLPGHPEIFVVSNIIEYGQHIGAYGGSKRYHSDLSYIPEPSLGSIFHCLECPEDGGETAVASMFAAYDALPEERRRWLEAHNGVHDYVWNYERAHTTRAPLTDEQKKNTPPIAHPAVRSHPESGRKALFFSEVFTRSFEGEDETESQALIGELMAFVDQPDFVYTHKWTPGDVLIWDNRSTMHKACPFDEEGTRRRMHRTTIRGDRPFLR